VIVIDASALVGLLLEDPATIAEYRELPADVRARLRAPALVEPETLSALRRLERHEIVPGWRAAQAVAQLGALRRVLYPHGPFIERVWELRHELTAYDAMYVAVAERIDALLFTADKSLARVAKRLLGAERVRAV
jgi:predicted nucleic acid-binding protein